MAGVFRGVLATCGRALQSSAAVRRQDVGEVNLTSSRTVIPGWQARPMSLHVASRRRTTLHRDFADALILDVTSKAPEPWIRLSPFYPHGDIPVPGHPGRTSQSVEAVWQALKVFVSEQEDFARREITPMKGTKRPARRLAPPLGHRLNGRLLGYEEARPADLSLDARPPSLRSRRRAPRTQQRSDRCAARLHDQRRRSGPVDTAFARGARRPTGPRALTAHATPVHLRAKGL